MKIYTMEVAKYLKAPAVEGSATNWFRMYLPTSAPISASFPSMSTRWNCATYTSSAMGIVALYETGGTEGA